MESRGILYTKYLLTCALFQFAHTRRKFEEALKCLNVDERKDSKAKIDFEYCNKLFKIKKNIKDLTPEEKYVKR